MLFIKGTSETTRENINSISIHRPDHKFPDNSQIGFYLAGLIDGDGWISDKNHQSKLVIAFHKKDIPLAYFLKNFFNNGTIRINNNSAVLVFTDKKTLIKICFLIHNKLKVLSKISRLNHLINNLLINDRESLIKLLDSEVPNKFSFLDNHYLAGLIDSDGCFSLRLINRKQREHLEVKTETRLYLRIELHSKDKEILEELKNTFGGYISFRKHVNKLTTSESCAYNTVSFKNMYKIIQYLDKFSLNSKYLEYTYMRKAYIMVQNKEHLTKEGLKKLEEYNNKLRRLKIE